MNPFPLKRPGQPEPLSETAAAWVLKAEDGRTNGADEERLRDWLRVPAHAQAFDNTLWALDSVQRHSASPELMAMREAALAKRTEPTRRYGWAAGLGAAAVAAAFLIWTGGLNAPVIGPAQGDTTAGNVVTPASASTGVYRTGIGERSGITLPDGSVATLDTDSQLRVAYTSAERGVYLLKGQALFEVAKGKPLPFQVYAAGQRITAVGTIFNVRVKGQQVQVSMVEGVVKVRPIHAAAKLGQPVQELTLRAGEALTTAQSETASVKPIDTLQVATWRGGLLVFEDETLSDAVAEINRYTDRPIRIADAIGHYRVTGVFKTNDPARFATAMSEIFPIEVQRGSSGATVLKRQP